MVRRILSIFTREIRGLHEAAYVLAGFSLLSQVLALVRDRTFAHLFGAGPVLDAYFAAFRIPDIVFAFLTLFVSSFALVPLLSARDEKEQGKLLGNVLFAFGTVAVAVAVVLWFTIPRLVPFLFPGFSKDALENTVTLSRLMLAQPVLLGLSSIASSVIQVLRRFVIFALAPILYNVGIIIGALFFYPVFGISGLAGGVVVGAVLHFAAQAIPLFGHTRHMVRPSFASLGSSIIDVAIPSMPRALALSAQQVLLLAFAGIASLTVAGTISALSFSFNLQSVPLTVIGLSYAAALFPALAALMAKGDTDGFIREVWASIRHIIFWTFPAITMIVVLRAHIVRVILGTGAFSWNDTRLTAALLACFALSLISQSVILIFSRAYYAAHETLTPIMVNVSAALVAALAAYYGVIWVGSTDLPRFFIEVLFRVGDVPGTPAIIIPLAYSLVMIVASFVFAFLFARKFAYESRTGNTLLVSFASSVIAGASAYGTLQLLGPLLPTATFVGLLTQGASAGIVGLVAWIATLYLLKSAELEEIRAMLHKQFPKPDLLTRQ